MAGVLIGQFGVYALAWVVVAWLVRDERGPALLWCVYCVLQAWGLQLLVQAAPLPGSPVLPLSAMLVSLLAYAVADAGIDWFANGRPRHLAGWAALWLGVSAVQLLVAWAQGPLHGQAVAYNLSVAVLLLVPLVLLQRPLRREFGPWGLLPLLPGALMLLGTLWRSAMLWAEPALLQAGGPAWAGDPARQMAALVAAGAFNIAFIGLVIARLVLRLGRRLDTDALTGLANRGGLEKHLAVAWAASQRHRVPVALAFIDIDRFKQINDAGGHNAGDRVIEGVAATLRHQARFTDQVGRWGGDEFMVVMPHTDLAAAQQAMQRLRDRVAAARIAVPAGCPPLTLSIGVAVRDDGDESVHDLVMRADALMYRAKKAAAAHRRRLGLGEGALDQT